MIAVCLLLFGVASACIPYQEVQNVGSINVYNQYQGPCCTNVINQCPYPYNDQNKPDYYWRVYTGEIPNDAVQGGYENGTTYIGQVPFPPSKALIPAILKPGLKSGRSTALGTTFTYSLYFTILCSGNLQRFKWIPTLIEDFESIRHKAVIGGIEIDKIVYVGKGLDGGRMVVGKIFENKEPNKGLWIPNDAGTHTNLLEFEALVYE